MLSIAIPSFNRPGELMECLTSVEREVTALAGDNVEVCVTDDASTDPDTFEVAASFAERCGFVSVHRQSGNVGIERNVFAACAPCRGDYLMMLGNDDLLLPGALETILEDILGAAEPVLLYSKNRITKDGSPRDAITDSTNPIEVPAGATHRFATMLDAASQRGLISTFGFIGPIVMERKRLAAIDPSPYLDLTMYAPMLALVEAFHDLPVRFRNVPTLLHRSPTQIQKHAEAVGRREEEFMTGGDQRRSRYFGTTLAAALQRLVDRGAIDGTFIARASEALLTQLPLVEWIAANRDVDPTLDERLDAEIVSDAERFFAAFAPSAG